MRVEDQKYLDLEALPEEARKELMDFYRKLIEKYGVKKRVLLPQGFYQPLKVKSYSEIAKREEIHER